MKNTDSKLISLLKAFSPEEFRQLEKFIDSPYFNKGRDLLPFFKVLKSFYPEFSHGNFNNEFLFQSTFPGKKFDQKKSENLIRALASHLFKVCKEFLVQLELESQVAKKKYFLLNQLRKKKLYKEFDREASEIENDADGMGSIGYFADKYLLNAVIRDCSLNRDDFTSSVEYTIKASQYVSLAALISLFKYEDEKNLARAFGIEPDKNFLASLLKRFDSTGFISDLEDLSPDLYPYVKVFHGMYMMNINRDNRKYYDDQKITLKKYSHLFGQPEKYILWNIMLTYCGVNRLGFEEKFELYLYMLDNNCYKPLREENFHVVLFRNIVLDTSAINKYEWLENFIVKYSPELHTKHRDNMKEYSIAYLLFAKGEYDRALEHILKVKYNLFLFKIDLKLLQAKIYYELNYIEEGMSLVSAALNYLSNSKEFPDTFKLSIVNFFKCMRELLRLKSGAEDKKESLHKISMLLKDNQFPSVVGWIEAKINRMKI